MANKFANRLPNRATAHGAGRPAAGDYTVVTRLNTSRGFANPTPLLDERTWGQRLENQSAERTKTGPAVRLVEGQMAQHDARTPGLPLDAERRILQPKRAAEPRCPRRLRPGFSNECLEEIK